jgi:hypothetical protein
MEPFVFAIVAIHKLYNQKESLVPVPLCFQPIDLRALKRLYKATDDSLARTADRQESLVTQSAS